MNAYSPVGAGSETKRGTTCVGMCTTESAACGNALDVEGVSEAIKQSERFPRWGNGWPGSIAGGVTTGITVRWK